MSKDFFYAFIIGLSLLFIFWLFIITFIYIRKPPKSRLSLRLFYTSTGIFLAIFAILLIFSPVDSF